jgi:hypothetical protein
LGNSDSNADNLGQVIPFPIKDPVGHDLAIIADMAASLYLWEIQNKCISWSDSRYEQVLGPNWQTAIASRLFKHCQNKRQALKKVAHNK